MRLWAIGWLALWGVVFGLNDNLVFSSKIDISKTTTGKVDAGGQQQEEIVKNKNNPAASAQGKTGNKANIGTLGTERNIAEKTHGLLTRFLRIWIYS